MKYKTKNRELLIAFLKENNDKHLSITEIQENLKDIPQASLYRLVDSLVQEGLILRYIVGPNKSACYQYADHNEDHHHFHLVCENCGKLIHLECDEVEELVHHIDQNHNFKVDISKVNLYGLCEECKKK